MAPLVGDATREADVLVARATPAGTGALAIVRLSGPPGRTLGLVRGLAPRLPERPEARRAYLSPFLDGEGAVVDEGLVLCFRAPASATGEEVVELHAHGAPAIVEALVDAAVARGARRAGPGEFTRRALANGKVDLLEAEGIGRLAAAGSRFDARRAIGLVRGELSRRLAELHERLLGALVELEARLDFPEDVGGEGEGAALRELEGVRAALLELGGEVGSGRSRVEVPTVVIVGPPNAGKSTLFNALLGEDRVLVTEHPGTTRDAVAEECVVAGKRVRLVDTAGLREADEPVERLGVDAARRAAAGADLLLLAVEAGGEGLGMAPATEAASVLPVATKADLGGAVPAGARAVSARTGEGLAALREEIAVRVGAAGEGGAWGALPRQRDALLRAAAALAGAGRDTPAELAAAAARSALHALGEVTGETASEELLDRVFSTFCVGK